MAEIADLDDAQLFYIYYRPRDEWGNLTEEEETEKPIIRQQVSFESMYKDLWTKRGLTEEQVNQKWQNYLAENPSLVKWLEKRKGNKGRRK